MLTKLIYTQRKLQIIALLSLSASSIFFAPSSIQAQTASASGSATLTILPNITTTDTITGGIVTGRTITQIGGFTSSVSGEVVLPPGYLFNGTVNIVPTFANSVVSNLAISPTSLAVVDQSSTFNRAAAQILINSSTGNTSINNNIDSVTAIIKAGAGVNGLD